MEENQCILKIIKLQIRNFENCLNYLNSMIATHNLNHFIFLNFELVIEFYHISIIYFNQYMNYFPIGNQTRR
jgi:hypothetical protein